MSGTTLTRGALIVLGVAAGLWGAVHLLATGTTNIVAAAKWLVAGVVLHDFVLSPLVVALALAVAALVHRRVRAPVIGGLIVLGTVTIAAVPELGRFGAKPDNPTLLPRDYTAGWLVFAAVVAVVVAALLVRDGVRRRRTPQVEGSSSSTSSSSP